MPRDYTPQVKKISIDAGTDKAGQYAPQVRVQYTVGDLAAPDIVVPANGFSAAAVNAAMAAYVNELQQIQGIDTT